MNSSRSEDLGRSVSGKRWTGLWSSAMRGKLFNASASLAMTVFGATMLCFCGSAIAQEQPPAGGCTPWPMCAAQPQGQGGGFTQGPVGQRPYHPQAAKSSFTIWTAMNAMLNTARRFSRVMDEPNYKPELNGTWAFPRPGPNDKVRKGDFCSAVYMVREGSVALTGPGGNFGGAMLTFYSNKIPKPKQMRKLKVTLTQPPDAPVTVTALNFTYQAIDKGAISFVVPTIGDALKNMTDKQQFKIDFDGEQVVQLSWKDGLKARDKLRSCLKGK
jgi:hypothetical protein